MKIIEITQRGAPEKLTYEKVSALVKLAGDTGRKFKTIAAERHIPYVSLISALKRHGLSPRATAKALNMPAKNQVAQTPTNVTAESMTVTYSSGISNIISNSNLGYKISGKAKPESAIPVDTIVDAILEGRYKVSRKGMVKSIKVSTVASAPHVLLENQPMNVAMPKAPETAKIIPLVGRRYNVSRKGMGGRSAKYDLPLLQELIDLQTAGNSLLAECRKRGLPYVSVNSAMHRLGLK